MCVLARDLDLSTDKPLGLDLTALKKLPATFPWRAGPARRQRRRGLLNTNRGILMLAAAPVLDGNGTGPARGMVIMGRLLSPAVVRASARRRRSVAMLPPAASDAVAEVLGERHSHERVPHLQRHLRQAGHALRVDVPREVIAARQEGGESRLRLPDAAAVIVLVLLVVVLNRVILNPLALVTRHAVALGEDTDLTTRLDLRAATRSACWRASSTAWWSASPSRARSWSTSPSRQASRSSPRACCTTSATP